MRLVLTYNFGSVWYAELTIPFMRRYAQRVGAEFLEIASFADPVGFGSSHSWIKIEAIRFLASQSRYNSMLLVDADALILPHCPDIFDLAGDQISVIQDMGIPEVDENFRHWSLRHFGRRPIDGPYFNAGVLVIPQPAARRMAPILNGPYPDGWPTDQNYLNLMLPQHETLKWLPHSFNWLAPQFREAALEQNLVHFVGDHKGLLPDFVAQIGPKISTDESAVLVSAT